MRHTTKVAALAVAVSILAVGAGVANGSTAPQATDNGMTVTSSAESSQSMVKGSSPTSLGDSPLAQTPAGRSVAAAATVTDIPSADTISFATAVLYDPKTGQTLARHRYGPRTEGRRLRPPTLALFDHGTAGTSSASGCIRVTVTQVTHDLSGLSKVGTWRVWTDWCWTRSNQVVSVNDTGVSQGHDATWSYDGVLTEFNENHYYDFSVNDGHPRSAYMFVRSAKFHGPCINLSLSCQWTPKNSLASYYNGTWQWWTSS